MTEQDSSKSGMNDDNVSPATDHVSPEETDTQEGQDAETSQDDSSPSSDDSEEKKEEEKKEEEPEDDPIDDLFGEAEPDPANLSGSEHLRMAVDKKFDDLREGIENGDPEAIKEFQSLKPKIQEGVAKRFRVDGEEVQNAAQLLDFLATEYDDVAKEEKPTGISPDDAETIRKDLIISFREQAEKSGLKFEELKKQGTYGAVVDAAKRAIAKMQKYNAPSSDFDQFFDFGEQWEIATAKEQQKQAYKEGQAAQKKVNTAHKSSPSRNSEIDTGTEGISPMTSADFMKLSKDDQIKYQKVHKGVFLD